MFLLASKILQQLIKFITFLLKLVYNTKNKIAKHNLKIAQWNIFSFIMHLSFIMTWDLLRTEKKSNIY